ncbi:MAG: tetratricopeptide repeat protein [Gemmataceae bacterium]
MGRIGELAVLGLMAAGAASVWAQGPGIVAPRGRPVAVGGGVAVGGPRVSASFYFNTLGWGYCAPCWWGGSFTNVSVTVIPPPVVIVPPPVVIVPPPEPRREEPIIADPLVILPRKPPPEAPLPGVAAGGFRPIHPDERARAVQPAPPPPEPPLPAPRPDDPIFPRPPLPTDPHAEMRQLVNQGRQAFADQEYGRAARLFRLATQQDHPIAMSYFLLAEAEFALGKYREAVASIHAGLRLQPDWPTQRFRPRELYGVHQADYQEHLRRLEAALNSQPNDPVLLFLVAYHLWFDGRPDDARNWFQRVLPRVAKPEFVELFLKVPVPPAANRDLARIDPRR